MNTKKGVSFIPKALLLTALPVLMLSGCISAPETKSQQSVRDLHYQIPPSSMTTSGSGYTQMKWWRSYHSETLNQLVDQGLHANPNLKAQVHVLQQQFDLYQAERGSLLFPTVNLGVNTERQKLFFGPGVLFGPFNLYNTGVNVSYGIDLWGASRLALKEILSQLQAQNFQYEASEQTLAANIVTAAMNLAYELKLLDLQQRVLADQNRQLSLLKIQYQSGAIDQDSLLAQEQTLSNAQAVIPQTQKSIEQLKHQLNALLGRSPDAQIDSGDLAQMKLPAPVPVALPAQLLVQRPDIRAAEALWDAAASQVGVAKANMLPQFTLTASTAFDAITLSKLFRSKSLVWALGGNLTQPLFDGGALKNKKKAAIEAMQSAGLVYRQTVVTAFQQVADALTALQHDQQTLQYRTNSLQQEETRLRLAQTRYVSGATSLSSLISEQSSLKNIQITVLAAQSSLLADSAALYQAMGGNWSGKKSGLPQQG